GAPDELLYNLGWRRYAHSITTGQVAGSRTRTRLRVTPTPLNAPGVLVVLESVVVDAASAAAQFVTVDVLGSILVDLSATFPNHAALDYRMVNAGGSLTRGSQVIISDAIDGVGNTVGIFYSGIMSTVPGTVIPNIRGICLTGGMGLQVDFANFNVGANVQYVWRERLLNDQEGAI